MAGTKQQDIINRFRARTPKSQAMSQRARQVLPGGDTRSGVFYAPYAAFMVDGAGAILTDVDGNRYLDFLNNFTSLVHGHAHPALVGTAKEQLSKGSVYASPMIGQVELAELISARVPGVETVRFTNSGSEATLMAIRAARGHTGRSGILKMHGSYHGSHDLAAATADPVADRGIPDGLRQDLYFAPFNDLNSVEAIFHEQGHRIAGILVEPILNAGGIVVPRNGYLQGLREIADKHNALLIFDEVVTLRLSEGGYQQIAAVTPDLTAMGKVIGGGFAVGAFGGKREIMQQFDPGRKGSIPHSGTFNGHGATMAAGLAAMKLLDRGAIDRINKLGERLARGFDDAFAAAGIHGRTTRAGSLVQVHWHGGEIRNASDTDAGFRAAGSLPALLHLEMMNRGIFFAARGELNTTTVMSQRDIDHAVRTFSEALLYLKDCVEEVNPALILR